MHKVETCNTIPENSLICKDFGTINYWDCYKIRLTTEDTVDKVVTEIFETPKWINCLMSIRNFLVKPLGLTTDSLQLTNESDYYPVGAKPFFTVIDRNDCEIVMGGDDKHLNGRASVLLEHAEKDTAIYLTTLVKYNNIWGKIYFFTVRPFHRIIVKSLLKKYKSGRRESF